MRLWVVVVLLLVVVGRAEAMCDKKYPDSCRMSFQGGIYLPTSQSMCLEGTIPAIPAAGKVMFYCRAGAGLCSLDSTGTERCTGGAGGGGGTNYQTWMDEGVALPGRPFVNWIGQPVNCVDNSGANRTDCTVNPSVNGVVVNGDLSGTLPAPQVSGLNGANLLSTAVPPAGAMLVVNGANAWAQRLVNGDWTMNQLGTATLKTTGPGVVTVGDATHVPQVTTDAQGRVSAMTPILISPGASTFDQLGGGNNTSATMQCSGTCAMSGNITAAGLAATTACSGNLYAKGMSNTGSFNCSQVAIPQLASATSAQMASMITDETGTGQIVFGQAPTILSAQLSGVPSVYAEMQLIDQATATITPPAGSNVYLYARNNQFCYQGNQGGEHCSGSGAVTGPTPPVVANSIATFNGTGGTAIQASPCTIDANGIEDCPAPLGTTQGSLIIKEGQGYGTATWALTLGAGALATNYVCAINPATGGIPASCLDPVDLAHGGTFPLGPAKSVLVMNPGGTASQWGAVTCEGGGAFTGTFPSTCARNFDNLSPMSAKGQLITYQTAAPHSIALAGSTVDGYVLTYDSSQTGGMKWAPSAAGVAPILASAAPFTCSATTGGLYVDTDCGQWCVCNSGQAKWCRSDTGACLSATDCCVGTTTTTTTSSTTTTAAGGSTTTTTTSTTTTTTSSGAAAADWTSSFLAVWLMEEATDGPWLSQVNSPTRNFTQAAISGNHATKDTTNFIQGTASVSGTGTVVELYTSGTTGDALQNPTLTAGLSFGCWARDTHNDSSGTETAIFGSMTTLGAGNGGGFGIEEIDVSPRWRALTSYTGSIIYADPGAADGTTRGAFAHVVGVYHNDGGAGVDSLKTFVNGTATATQTGTAGVRIMATANTYVTGLNVENISTTRPQTGNLDECFVGTLELTAPDVCRICSCGINGASCTCSGTSYVSAGRNTTKCGSCTLPNCNLSAP